jgi:hypothetical protein
VILFVRGRWQLLGALFFLGFHAANTAILLIHFLPTVVCWLAFAPLERVVPWWQARRSDRHAGETENEPEQGRQAQQQAGA